MVTCMVTCMCHVRCFSTRALLVCSCEEKEDNEDHAAKRAKLAEVVSLIAQSHVVSLLVQACKHQLVPFVQACV
jgi:hypothetical protein